MSTFMVRSPEQVQMNTDLKERVMWTCKDLTYKEILSEVDDTDSWLEYE